MKKILILLGVILALTSCEYSAAVEAYNWTLSPARDVECEVNGTPQVVPGTVYPYMAAWTLSWDGLEANEIQVAVRVREIADVWSNYVYATAANGDTLYVEIEDGVFTVSKNSTDAPVVSFSDHAPDLEHLEQLKREATP